VRSDYVPERSRPFGPAAQPPGWRWFAFGAEVFSPYVALSIYRWILLGKPARDSHPGSSRAQAPFLEFSVGGLFNESDGRLGNSRTADLRIGAAPSDRRIPTFGDRGGHPDARSSRACSAADVPTGGSPSGR